MPYATNPVDGVRTYFEDSGGARPPVLFYTGFADPLEVAKSAGLARMLSGEFRLIFADHRGQGGSDKPRKASAYALATRVGDAVAVLDALSIERAHFPGSSWGARLGFALGEHAPERVLSLVLCGNQPYAWNLESPTANAIRGDRRLLARRNEGFRRDLRIGARLPVPRARADVDAGEERPGRTRRRLAIRPARGARLAGPAQVAGAVPHLRRRSGRDVRRRQACGQEIPGARFVSLAGHSHISAFYEADDLLLPHILELLRSATH
jgi:pimeloyl-ACP methyl ester carboxylesterase